MLVTFVTAGEFFPMQKKWIEEIRARFPNVIGIMHNVNPEKTNVILGRKWRKLFGQDFLIERLNRLRCNCLENTPRPPTATTPLFRVDLESKSLLARRGDRVSGGRCLHEPLKLKVSAGSFFQVNTAMAKKLYETVRNEARGEGGLLLDLYCGVGGMALSCAPFFQKVIGVDETFSSISNANENQRLNGLSNCRFYCQDVRLFLKKNFLFSERRKGDFQAQIHSKQKITLVADPPRAGCDEEVLKQMVRLRPQKIIYVSCEPSTLARDLKFLLAHKFQVLKVQPLDMFPQSSHVESVTVLKG
jgi:23S rRNA (uracil1939-C5)-methyltransferase